MYTMKQASELVGMSYESLKFYCNQGLVPNLKRNSNNHRVFSDRDIACIKSIICLKNCGMSISEMKEYIDLCWQGETSIPERKKILARKRSELEARIAVINESLAYIDWKQQFYDDVLSGKTKYYSNILPEEE